MNHFKKIYYLIKAIGNQLKSWFLELPRYKQVVAVVGAIAIIMIAYRILPSKTTIAEVADLPPSATSYSILIRDDASDLCPFELPITIGNKFTQITATITSQTAATCNNNDGAVFYRCNRRVG